jgi:hypothetical protein
MGVSRLLVVASTTILVFLALSGPAAGAVRGGAMKDGDDQHDRPDLAQVNALYDEAGSMAVAVRLHDAIDESHATWQLTVYVSEGLGCSDEQFVAIETSTSPTADAEVSVVGRSEEDPQIDKQVSPDARTIQLVLNGKALKRRDYRCVDVGLSKPSAADFYDDVSFYFKGYAPRTLPTMTTSRARGYARRAVRDYLGYSPHFRPGCERQGRTKQRCRVGWRSGNLIYRGATVVFYRLTPDNEVTWDYRIRLERADRRCVRVFGWDFCSEEV